MKFTPFLLILGIDSTLGSVGGVQMGWHIAPLGRQRHIEDLDDAVSYEGFQL